MTDDAAHDPDVFGSMVVTGDAEVIPGPDPADCNNDDEKGEVR